eukprot:scaffold954_cov111-Isochrysis_galbana.AAC.1
MRRCHAYHAVARLSDFRAHAPCLRGHHRRGAAPAPRRWNEHRAAACGGKAPCASLYRGPTVPIRRAPTHVVPVTIRDAAHLGGPAAGARHGCAARGRDGGIAAHTSRGGGVPQHGRGGGCASDGGDRLGLYRV